MASFLLPLGKGFERLSYFVLCYIPNLVHAGQSNLKKWVSGSTSKRFSHTHGCNTSNM